MKMYSFYFVILQQCCLNAHQHVSLKQSIYFGAFISNIVEDDLCFKAAIDAAVQLINEDDTILKDFELKMEYLDNYVSKIPSRHTTSQRHL